MKRALLIAAGLFIVLLTALWWYLFHTDAGTRSLFARLSTSRTVHIAAEGVAGHLAGPLKIKHIVIDHKLVHIEVDDLLLELSPAALFAQTIKVDSATATRARVEVKKVSESEAAAPKFFPSFMQLVANRIDIRDARVTVYDNFVQSADRVRGRLRLTAQRLDVEDIQIDAPPNSATATLAVRARRPIELQVNGRITTPAPRGPALEATVALSGPVTKLHLEAGLTAPSEAQLRGDIGRSGDRWQLLGDLTSKTFAFDPWLQRPPLSLRDVALKVDATPDDLHVAGSALVPEVDAAPLQIDLHGQYAARVIAITRGELRPAKSDMSVITAARIDLTQGHPVVAATAKWTNFRWPLREDYFVSPQGQLSMSGSLPYDVGINADVNTLTNIAGRLSAHGALSDGAIEFDEMALQVLNGDIKGTAKLNFSPAREWRVAVSGKSINPQALYDQLPGKIDFDVDASGAGLDRRADFAITLPMLKGVVRNQPLEGHGYVSHDVGGWTAREFLLNLGANRLAASGTWRDKIDLAWSLDVPELKHFLSDATGELHFQGTAHGTQRRPQLAGSLIGKKMRFGEWNAATLSLAGNIDLSDQLASRLDLQASEIGWRDFRFDTWRTHAEGKASAHIIALRGTTSKNGAISKVSTDIDGAYAKDTWRAHITPVELADKEGDAPTGQSTPGQLVWQGKQASVENVCMLWTTHKLCANGRWSPEGSWRVDAESDSLPLSMFNDTFPKKSHYQGSWILNAKLAGTAAANWTGDASMAVTNASLAFQPIAGAEELVRLGSGRVDLTASADKVIATARIVTPGTTSIDAGARIDRRPSVELMQSPLNGELRAATGDANLLPLFFPDLDRSAGELSAQVRVGGTLAAPLLQGQIDLQKGELDLYRYNLSVRELGVAARIADNRLTFEGQAQIGKGKLGMNGALAWRNLEPVGNLHLQGENLLVANLPEYRVTASPNVDFKIDGKRVAVNGEVVIPSAHIEPHDLRGAVQTSRDVRFVGEMPEPPLGGFDVRSEVRVRLGDDVQLDTYGLQGKLGGAVLISTSSLSSIGRGELNVADGHYEAYGQKLDIARGRLLFDASPLDDPGLDIQAARKVEDTRVGVNVRGTLRAPRVTLFSEPGLPQSQIVSMLLTGKRLADLSSRDAATVGAAQSDLRVQGGSVLAAQIGRRIGLEEVGVESTGLNDTALVLGKFLSPRLFVSYGISLTESINTLKLRYTISDRWLIRTEAGQNQSADVEYRIER